EAIWLFLNRRFLPWALVARWRGGLISTLVLITVLSLLPGVSGWAHLGGALAGGAAGLLLNVQRFQRPPWCWLALVGLIPVFAAGFIRLDWARATQKNWREAEEFHFAKHILTPVIEAAELADKIYDEQAVALLQRDPRRRDPNSVAYAEQALAEQLRLLTS